MEQVPNAKTVPLFFFLVNTYFIYLFIGVDLTFLLFVKIKLEASIWFGNITYEQVYRMKNEYHACDIMKLM